MGDQREILSIQQAMEQNAEFFGFDLCDRIRISDAEVLEIPYRELLDRDKKKAVDQVYAEYDGCDRQTIEYSNEKGEVTSIQGGFKDPRQKDGEIFDLDERVSVAIWGQDVYDRFVKAGGPPGLVLITWQRMRSQISKKVAADSKSD